MEKDAANNLIYLLRVRREEEGFLAPIRKWEDLKLAREGEWIWVKGFDAHQLARPEVQCIPNEEIFYGKEEKLFPLRSLLPKGRIPQLLWTPIQKALPVQVAQFNHNYFGVAEGIGIQLKQEEVERSAVAMQVGLATLGLFLESCAEVRLQNLRWTLVGDENALLIGEPLLPLPGTAYWQTKTMFFPLGYHLALSFLSEILREKLDPNPSNLIFWTQTGSYLSIAPEQFRPLTLSSFRKTKTTLQNK